MSFHSRGVKLSYKIGARLMEEITHHRPNSGGVSVVIAGSKGSGKTTLLLTLADSITCEDPLTHKTEKETIIWRGRNMDSWNWLPKERICVFIHARDIRSVKFMDDIRRNIPKSELPEVERYTSFNHLLSRLRLGKINVVYEPSTYFISQNIKGRIRERGMVNEDLFKNIDNVSPYILRYF